MALSKARRASLALSVALFALAACSTLLPTQRPAKTATGDGVIPAWFDRAVNPGDDFYQYALGGWLQATQIPPDRTTYGVDAVIAEQVESDLHQIAEAAAAAPVDETQRKLGDFYASFMDTGAIEAKGLAPLKPRLDAIAEIENGEDLAHVFVDGVASFGASPVTIYVAIDAKKPDAYAAHLAQSGLGMPNRDYYLRWEKQYQDYRAAYRAYVEQMLTLAGVTNGRARSEQVLALEIRIARAHWPAAESRDATKTHNPMTLADLALEAPGVDWRALTTAAHIDGGATLIVVQKSALTNIAGIVATTPLEVWKSYLTFHLLDQAAPFLPQAFDDAAFAFRGKTLGGRSAPRERWRRAVRLLDSQLSQAFGQAYVARRLGPAARASAVALASNIKAALREIVAESAFSPAAIAEAQAKLDALTLKIGAPDRWRDYTELTIVRGDLMGDVDRAARFDFHRNVAKLAAPVDRADWRIAPHVVSARNDVAHNELTLTAAILQPPYFDPSVDAAANYGAIGAVIGHELSHTIDEQGRKFDAKGEPRDWWAKADADAYAAEAAKLVAQVSAYEPLQGLRLNGKQTLGENAADLAGLAVAYRAYQRSLNGKAAPVRNGLTGDQRFFLAFAQSLAAKRTEQALRQQIQSSASAPERYRVNGALRNFDPWYAAFGVKQGDALYLKPEDRARPWSKPPT